MTAGANTASKPMLNALQGQTVSPPPLWLMRQAGRYLPEYRKVRADHPDFIAFCFNPQSAAEVTLQPIHRFGFDAAIVFADILLLPHVVGATVTFTPGDGPTLQPLTTTQALEALDWTAAPAGLAPVMETLKLTKAELPPTTTLIGFAGAPWTVATYMLGGGKGDEGRRAARAFAYANPMATAILLDALADATGDYLAAQLDAGADCVQLFESWAEGLSPMAFEAWVTTPTTRVVQRLRAHGHTAPVIGFPRGATEASVASYVSKTGVTALALDTSLARAEHMQALPGALPLQGGLDPAALVAGDQALVDETRRLLDATRARPYVFNLGHGIWPSTPIAHVQKLIELVRARATT